LTIGSISISIPSLNSSFIVDQDFILIGDQRTLIRYFGPTSSIIVPIRHFGLDISPIKSKENEHDGG